MRGIRKEHPTYGMSQRKEQMHEGSRGERLGEGHAGEYVKVIG
jgi:hypothetical protein